MKHFGIYQVTKYSREKKDTSQTPPLLSRTEKGAFVLLAVPHRCSLSGVTSTRAEQTSLSVYIKPNALYVKPRLF